MNATITMQIPKELRIAIRKSAAENDRSMSEDLRVHLAAAYGVTIVTGEKRKKVAREG